MIESVIQLVVGADLTLGVVLDRDIVHGFFLRVERRLLDDLLLDAGVRLDPDPRV